MLAMFEYYTAVLQVQAPFFLYVNKENERITLSVKESIKHKDYKETKETNGIWKKITTLRFGGKFDTQPYHVDIIKNLMNNQVKMYIDFGSHQNVFTPEEIMHLQRLTTDYNNQQFKVYNFQFLVDEPSGRTTMVDIRDAENLLAAYFNA